MLCATRASFRMFLSSDSKGQDWRKASWNNQSSSERLTRNVTKNINLVNNLSDYYGNNSVFCPVFRKISRYKITSKRVSVCLSLWRHFQGQRARSWVTQQRHYEQKCFSVVVPDPGFRISRVRKKGVSWKGVLRNGDIWLKAERENK